MPPCTMDGRGSSGGRGGDEGGHGGAEVRREEEEEGISDLGMGCCVWACVGKATRHRGEEKEDEATSKRVGCAGC